MLFKILSKRIKYKKDEDGRGAYIVPESLFKDLIRAAIRHVYFDESWYLENYPDVAKAVAEGKLKSGHQHFINAGYFEGRLPFDVKVDSDYYLTSYPDVATALKTNKIRDAQHHFRKYGAKEGRSPRKGFSFFEESKVMQFSLSQRPNHDPKTSSVQDVSLRI